MKPIFRIALAIVIVLGAHTSACAQCDTSRFAADSLQWVLYNGSFTGQIFDLERYKDTLYFSGSFDYIGKYHGSFTAVDSANGDVVQTNSWPKTNGAVYTAVPDGSGGFFIGGKFRRVGDSVRNNIAHINSSGQVSAFNPGANDTVYTMVLNSSNLYAGGTFTKLGDSTRNRVGSVNAATAAITSWNPNCNGKIFTMVDDGTALYVGGKFTAIASSSRSSIASFTLSSGSITSWNPGVDPGSASGVKAIAVNSNTVFIGGEFNDIGDSSRRNLGSVDKSSGAVSNFDPKPVNGVTSLLLTRDIIYAGGMLINVAGEKRSKIAALDTATGVPVAWDPFKNVYVPGDVYSLALAGNILYIGGDFSFSTSGIERTSLTGIDTATGSIRPVKVSPNFSAIRTISSVGSKLFLGGTFSSLDGVERKGISGLDLVNNKIIAWSPDMLGNAFKIMFDNDTLYAGGQMAKVNGNNRKQLAAFDVSNNYALTSWDPFGSLSGYFNGVRNLTTHGNYLYVSGEFNFTHNGTHSALIRIQKTTRAIDTWAPIPYQSNFEFVNALGLSGNILYAGGFFKSGSSTYNNLLRYDLSNNTGYFDSADAPVQAFYTSGGNVYIGGSFNNVNAVARRRGAAKNVATNDLLSWHPNVSQGLSPQIYHINGYYDKLILGGIYTVIDGKARRSIAITDSSAGTVYSAWRPSFNNTGNEGVVYDTYVYNDTVFAAGRFDDVDDKKITGLARFILPYKAPQTTVTVPSDSVCDGTVVTLTATAHSNVSYSWFNKSQLLAITGNTFTYKPADGDTIACVVLANANSCFLADVDTSNAIGFKVTPTDTPKVSITATSNPVSCEGIADTFTVAANLSGGTYQWRLNSMDVSGATSVTHIYTPADKDTVTCIFTVPATGCYSKPADTAAHIVVSVTPKTIPSINITGPSMAVVGATVTLNASVVDAGSSYNIRWSNNGNAFTTTPTPSATYTKTAGTDNITAVITPVGCYDTAVSNTISVQEDVSIRNVSSNNNIAIYPNPADDIISIKGLEKGDVVTITGLADGRVITSFSASDIQSAHKISVKDLVPGSYVVSITDGNGKINNRFVLQKK